METVTVFLRTPLFSTPTPESHLPAGCQIVEARVIDRPSGGLLVETIRLLDGRGELRSEAALTLFLPWSKVDHVLQQGKK